MSPVNQSSSCDSTEIAKELDEFVEHLIVQDNKTLNRMTDLIKIRDPCNGNLIVSIRDPKCKIEPYKTREGIINIQEHIEKRELPKFYKGQPSISYKENNNL